MARHPSPSRAPIWGVSAEFDSADGMVAALRALADTELGRIDAFSPVPVPEVADALRLHRQPMAPFAIGGALLGGAGMFGMCTFATVVAYRFNIGGRPQFAWPAFLVPSFSFAMLGGSLATLLAFFVLNRLPRLNHPAFNIPGFDRSTNDRYFVAVEARDDKFDPAQIEAAFAGLALRPLAVNRVAR